MKVSTRRARRPDGQVYRDSRRRSLGKERTVMGTVWLGLFVALLAGVLYLAWRQM